MDGGVGHTAWAPEGREGRSQAGPKGRQLEVMKPTIVSGTARFQDQAVGGKMTIWFQICSWFILFSIIYSAWTNKSDHKSYFAMYRKFPGADTHCHGKPESTFCQGIIGQTFHLRSAHIIWNNAIIDGPNQIMFNQSKKYFTILKAAITITLFQHLDFPSNANRNCYKFRFWR